MSWEHFEALIARLAEQIAPDAVVRHQHRVTGRSGVTRKLDVTISAKLGLVPIFQVIECKKHSRMVRAGDVAAFANMRDDVSASSGILVSASGFTKGAIRLAKEFNIHLLSHRDSTQLDQTELLGANSQLYIVMDELRIDTTMAFMQDENDSTALTLDEVLIDEDGKSIGTVREYRNQALSAFPRGVPLLGPIKLSITPPNPIFLQDDNGIHPVLRIEVAGEKIAKMYTTAMETRGNVLVDAHTRDIRFRQFEQSVDWRAIAESQEGQELTLSEYLMRGQKNPRIGSQIEESDGVLSLKFTEKPDP